MTTPENVLYFVEAVHQLLECPVCLERFDQPKVLPCQHTFCLTPCLERLADAGRRTLRCPECRADHAVPGDGPSHFPNNLTTARLLDLSLQVPPHNRGSRHLAAGGGGYRAAVAGGGGGGGEDNSPSVNEATPRNNYHRKGWARVCFGGKGSGGRQFNFPCGVAVSPVDDAICVADTDNHRVQVFDEAGVSVKTFVCQGPRDAQSNAPSGIAVNGSGHVIVSDSQHHRVQIFDSDGNFQRAFGSHGASDGQLNWPYGVACDNMDFIYVCDRNNHRIQVFNAHGEFRRTFGRRGNGNGHFEYPRYVAVSRAAAADNKLYVSDSFNHRIQVFSIHGEFLLSFGTQGAQPGQFDEPKGIAVDHHGFVVVGDGGNSRVEVFRADGRYFAKFGSEASANGQFDVIGGCGRVVPRQRRGGR